jgi:hypothetical protein
MMLPIVDYGGIAIVVPKISAVSEVRDEGGKHLFDVYLAGRDKPVSVFFDSGDAARDNRDELVAIIARYYYMRDLGPDFDAEDMEEMVDEGEDGMDFDDGDDDKRERH